MSKVSVLYDACVLYPAPLCDLFMRLALRDIYRAKWTNEIHDEWIRNLLQTRHDISKEKLERTRDLMNMHVRDCLVDGYEHLIDNIQLPDPNDRHVLAAAIHSDCSLILTFNLRDFPHAALSKFGISAIHPDIFLCKILAEAPDEILYAMRTHRQSLKTPRFTHHEYLSLLERQGLKIFYKKMIAMGMEV